MNGMRVDSALQAARFLYSAAFDAAACLLFCSVSAWQRPRRIFRGALLDTAWWLITLIAFVILILGPCGGELRLYHLLGVGSGAAAARILGPHKKSMNNDGGAKAAYHRCKR